ncbi:unnamed protein product [Closterium sp. NIES-65]|nr:unnamed protein product [Closterium sp. NIES-65]
MDSFPSPPLLPAPSPPRATVATLPRRLASPGRIGWERGAAQCRAEKEASGAERGVDSGNEGVVGGAAMRWRGGHQDREQPNDSDSNEGSDPGRRKRRERRTFSKSAREECWKQAAMVEGRSGERCARGEAGRGVEGADGMCKGMGGGGGGGGGARFVRRSGRRWGGWSWWRRDVLGNVVFRPLLGCTGPLCFDFDHIVPFAKGGTSDVHNCQVLQVAANRAKGSAVSDSWRQDAQPMSTRQPSGEDMDVLELAAYGDVWHGTTRYVLHSPACDRLQHPSSTRRASAGTMKHSKVGGSKAAASSARGSGCTLQ